jgi:competence protein ComEC
VRFRVLHPPGPGYSGNDASCVLRVDAGGQSLLLTGDIGRRVESRLVGQLGQGLAADLLVAAHHGSNTSSSAPFLDTVGARWVLYASGYANRYGFPAPAVRERVAAAGAAELDTAQTGAIGFHLGPRGLRGPFLYRLDHPRLWRRSPTGGADAFRDGDRIEYHAPEP